jgi:hypothetical protein
LLGTKERPTPFERICHPVVSGTLRSAPGKGGTPALRSSKGASRSRCYACLVGHWWTATENGQVVDASWEDPGIAYVGERIGLRKLEDGLAAYKLQGDLITDLGVYVNAPAAVVHELERKRAATGDDLGT